MNLRLPLLMLLLLLALPCWASPLTFDSLLKESHLAADATSVTLDFHFENKSGKKVVIQRYDAGCSCMSVAIQDGKLGYLPGEKGLIRIVYDMKTFSGVVEKSVMLYVDHDPEDAPSVVLTARIHIPVLVVTEPKTVKWGLDEEPLEKVVTVTMNHSKPIHVLRVTGTADGIQHEIRVVEEGKVYELVLKPKATNQPALGIFRIETDCDIEKHRVQQVFAVIRK